MRCMCAVRLCHGQGGVAATQGACYDIVGPCFACCAVQCAHIMAMAVQRLHKGAQVTIGPWIERGFYYDFDMPQASI